MVFSLGSAMSLILALQMLVKVLQMPIFLALLLVLLVVVPLLRQLRPTDCSRLGSVPLVRTISSPI